MNTNHNFRLALILFSIVTGCFKISAQELTKELPPFTKILVGPRIDLVIVDGDENNLKADFKNISSEKLNIQVKNNKLNLYLDDARISEKKIKIKDKYGKNKIGIYNKDVLVKVVVTCQQLGSIEVRGEQKVYCEKPIEIEKFMLKAYCEPNIIFKSLNAKKLITKLYGKSQILIENGCIKTQKCSSYGEAKVLLNKVENQSTKLTSIGENEFQISGNNTVRIFSIGEGKFYCRKNTVIKKSLVLGENTIAQLD